jgi:hypothetical protein
VELISAGRTFKENPKTNKFQGRIKGLLQDPAWGQVAPFITISITTLASYYICLIRVNES